MKYLITNEDNVILYDDDNFYLEGLLPCAIIKSKGKLRKYFNRENPINEDEKIIARWTYELY